MEIRLIPEWVKRMGCRCSLIGWKFKVEKSGGSFVKNSLSINKNNKSPALTKREDFITSIM